MTHLDTLGFMKLLFTRICAVTLFRGVVEAGKQTKDSASLACRLLEENNNEKWRQIGVKNIQLSCMECFQA